MINAVWLTVNRACNFRCPWCYAKGTRYSPKDNMSLRTARRLIKIGQGIGTKNFILLGGEPTLWPHLNEVCRSLGNATIITNGWRYADRARAEKDLSTGASISISLKAGNRGQYKQLTKVDAFDKVLLAVRNLVQLGQPPHVSITANALVADNLDELIKVSFDHGACGVTLELCSPVFDCGKPRRGYMLSPQEMADRIVALDYLFDACPELVLTQSLPFCLYPDGFLDQLKQRGQLLSGCHVIQRKGIIFTPKGGLLLCNALHDFELGRLGVDFHDAATFKQFWNRKEVVEANETLVCYPHHLCQSCETYNACCGGCPLQWMVFDPKVIGGAKCISMK